MTKTHEAQTAQGTQVQFQPRLRLIQGQKLQMMLGRDAPDVKIAALSAKQRQALKLLLELLKKEKSALTWRPQDRNTAHLQSLSISVTIGSITGSHWQVLMNTYGVIQDLKGMLFMSRCNTLSELISELERVLEST